jgi:flagellar hook-basal body complex protein FliE
MPVPITAVPIPQSIPAIEPAVSPRSPGGGEFQSILSEAVGQVERFQQNSASTIDKFLSGEEEEVHKVALAVDQAQMAFDLFLQVRNKVISAYQEVMRMQM